MSNKSSIVTSAADGCGKPSSIRPMDNLPSRDHKGAEYKESFMFSNRSTIYRGCSLAAATLAAVACIGLAGTAWASTVIYQDNFSGSSSTPLNGAKPTVDNGTSTAWTATGGSTAFADSGYTSESNSAGAVAYLNFTPVSGHVYTLSAGLYTTSVYTPDPGWDWLAVGFVLNPTTTSGTSFVFNETAPGAYAFMQVYAPGSASASGTAYSGPDGGNSPYIDPFNAPSGTANGPQNVSIVLDTGASAWTYQFFDNGAAVSPIESFSSNPAITAVGLNTQGPNTVVGQVSNFELTSSPVPEPATLGLFAVGGLALVLIGRKRATGRSV